MNDSEAEFWRLKLVDEHERLERLHANFDRAIALSWELETLADRLAARCYDVDLVNEYAAWKKRVL